jgi:hypothetical protein
MVYYAVSREVSKGNDIYSEIFFGHPPLQIYLYVGLIKLFGFHIWILKLFTLLVSISISVFLYLYVKDNYNEKTAFLSSLLFLTTYDALIFGSFAFGIEISLLFFMISLYFLNKKPLISGIFFALCLATRLHLAPLGLILLIFSEKKLKFLLGTTILLPYYLYLATIPEFIPQVFGYHTDKLYWSKGWIDFIRANIHIWIFFFFGMKWIKPMITYILVSYMAFMLILRSVFEYYFIVLVVFLCIGGSLALLRSKYKKTLFIAWIFFIVLLLVNSMPKLYEWNKDYDDFSSYIDTLENKPLVGQSAITALLALKTDRNISKLQIDTNFQRKKVFNYSDSIVIYSKGLFQGKDFKCSLLDTKEVATKVYDVWDC